MGQDHFGGEAVAALKGLLFPLYLGGGLTEGGAGLRLSLNSRLKAL